MKILKMKIFHFGYKHCWHRIDYKYLIIEHGSPEYNQYQRTPIDKCCFCPKTREHEWLTQLISLQEFEEGIKAFPTGVK